mgnify:CR=1 FL=1
MVSFAHQDGNQVVKQSNLIKKINLSTFKKLIRMLMKLLPKEKKEENKHVLRMNYDLMNEN